MKITIEIDAPGAACISAEVVTELLQEIALLTARRGSADYYEPPHRLHVAATCAHDFKNDNRVKGEMFLEPCLKEESNSA